MRYIYLGASDDVKVVAFARQLVTLVKWTRHRLFTYTILVHIHKHILGPHLHDDGARSLSAEQTKYATNSVIPA